MLESLSSLDLQPGTLKLLLSTHIRIQQREAFPTTVTMKSIVPVMLATSLALLAQTMALPLSAELQVKRSPHAEAEPKYPPDWKREAEPEAQPKYPPDWKREAEPEAQPKYPPDWKREAEPEAQPKYPPDWKREAEPL